MDKDMMASNISAGVLKEIQKMCEKAVYVHCRGHHVDLVATTACKIFIIQNTLDIMIEVTMIFVKIKFGKDK